MKGRRLPWPSEMLPIDRERDMRPGDYAGPWNGHDLWLLRAPNGDWASLSSRTHTITEHDDGSVTFHPSVQFNTGAHWHGYLTRGEWHQ